MQISVYVLKALCHKLRLQVKNPFLFLYGTLSAFARTDVKLWFSYMGLWVQCSAMMSIVIATL